MQNKGAIKFFTILLTIVCIYQLSFTYITYREKKKAKEFAQGDPVKERLYIDSISNETVYKLLFKPLSFTFNDCQRREINLGLDLKGGMNVILEISVEEIIKSLSNYNDDSLFIAVLNLAKTKQAASHEDFVALFGQAFDELAPNGKMAQFFYGNPALKGEVDFNSTNKDILDVIRQEAEDAIENSFNILRSRIDHFGVVQPNIQRLETQGRILVELPGIDEPERVRELLQSTAKLEFWETFENAQVYKALLDANEKIKEMEEAESKIAKQNDSLQALIAGVKEGPVAEDTSKNTELLALLEPKDTAKEELALVDQLEAEETTDTSLTSDNFQKDYPLFAVLQPNVSSDGKNLMNGSVIGFARKKDLDKVNAYMAVPQVKALFPRNIKLIWSAKPIFDRNKKETDIYELHAIEVNSRDGKAPLGGDAVTRAFQDYDDRSGEAVVRMNMNADGSKEWARLTKENVGQFIAVVMDNYVYSSARVQGEIRGGSTEISGGFTVSEAKVLANILKSGKLDAPAVIIQEAVVGPSLGKEAIHKGLNSFVIAFIGVLLYMMFYYSRSAGSIADIALLANIFFLIGILASLTAVLTLPGIAGIVLTMGMAVDANVLIYERIREEIAAGKGIKMALADGYKNAMSAIIDGNVTTLLTGIILYIFGTGPIRGFATTLVIGICTTLFSAIFITRLIYTRLLEKNRTLIFDTPITHGLFKKVHFDFIKHRKKAYVASLIMITIGIGSLVVRGLNLGVDFTGGRTFVVQFDRDVSTVEIQSLLKKVYGQAPEVKIYGSDNKVKIVTKYKISESSTEVDKEVEEKLYRGLKPILGENVSFDNFLENYRQSSEKIGPTIADDIKRQAVIAVFLALIVIFIYILIRFRNWQFSFGGTLALAHDAFVVIAAFSLLYGFLPFTLEIDQAFIAAILTVVGYSINDTVVIYDRIREYIGLYPKRDSGEVLNMALNSTLGRTFNTSFTVIIVLLAIFLFGGEVIRGFIFALLIGSVAGVYSTVFIATPIVYDTVLKGQSKDALSQIRRT